MKNRFRLALGATLGLVCLSATIQADPTQNLPGKWQKLRYESSSGARDYYLYLPKALPTHRPVALMLMLHGCTQTAESFAQDTAMNLLAEKHAFVAVYPEQSSQANAFKCWNWFKPENQTRGGGELGITVGIIQKVRETVRIDAERIYVTGFSAGAAMAANLAACHSDLFSGAAVHSGLEFRAATNEADAQAAMRSGSSADLVKTADDAIRCGGTRGRLVSMVSIQGANDNIVNPVNAERVLRQSSRIHDLLDDRQANSSQNLTPIRSTQGQVPGGHRYLAQTFGGRDGEHLLRVSVETMNHAWSGSPRAGQYADPKGPKASEILWSFFSR